MPPQAPCTCSCTGSALRHRVACVSVDPKRLVADGDDAIFDRYERWEEEQGDGARGARIDAVLPLVPSRRSALDLGCGTGTKATAYLAREFDAVTAVDISARSIEVARQRMPGVEFLAGDMTRVEFPAEAFDLVTAFYSVLHVPAGDQPGVVARVASWLVPGGVFLSMWACTRATSRKTTGSAHRCTGARSGATPPSPWSPPRACASSPQKSRP